jgi:hypothetical protein
MIPECRMLLSAMEPVLARDVPRSSLKPRLVVCVGEAGHRSPRLQSVAGNKFFASCVGGTSGVAVV